MIKNIIIAIVMIFIVGTLAHADTKRSDIAKELTEKAIKAEVGLSFSVDPNLDTTLFIYRISPLKPKELKGDWKMFLFFIGTNTDYLKEKGFNMVRIYTSQSKDINDYVLKILY